MTYQFIKDYKKDNRLRKSFNQLAEETFGISFEAWYQQGFWNDNYICYSYILEDEVVSNVSVNTMKLIVEGSVCEAIQIGTVMTKPEHRRKGLARQLMQLVLKEYEQYAYFFLSADETAIPLYEQCGFVRVGEVGYEVTVDQPAVIIDELIPITLTGDGLLEIKKNSVPLTKKLSAIEDEHVFMFYYTQGFNECIYQLADNCYAIYEIEGEVLHLYSILSTEEYNLEALLKTIAYPTIKKIHLHFTPERYIKDLITTSDKTGGWMIREQGDFLKKAWSKFPTISKT